LIFSPACKWTNGAASGHPETRLRPVQHQAEEAALERPAPEATSRPGKICFTC
jgi:hypothetical protein